MPRVVKPGKKVLLYHHRNEATSHEIRAGNAGTGQLHNWNFDLNDQGDFLISGVRGKTTNINKDLAGVADVVSYCLDGNTPLGDMVTSLRRLA